MLIKFAELLFAAALAIEIVHKTKANINILFFTILPQ